jgi:3-hydroxyisobutyrate dehydrogenase-like beta-hydroxyacid dehydrogenase
MSDESGGTGAVRAGVVGLGSMGGAVAGRLVSMGFDTVVSDLDQEKVDHLVVQGARRPHGPIGRECDVLITSLPADAAAKAVLLESGTLADLSGGTLIELSTLLPATMSTIGEEARRHDVRVIDCPVSGGPLEAAAGALVLLVGGDDRDVQSVRDVLDALGTVWRVGGVGDAKAVKLINNMMAAGNLALAAEAFTLGTRLGVDPQRLFEIIDHSGGQSRTFSKRVPYVLADDLAARFPLYLAEKDTRLFLEVAEEHGAEPVLAREVQRRYAHALERGLGSLDMAAIFVASEQGADHPADA